MARDTLKKAVIVAGGRGTAVCPLASYYPKLAFPIGHAPVIAHLLNYLHKNGITDVAIVASENSDAARKALQACVLVPSEHMRVEWFFDDGTKGTAGSLKPAEAFVGDADFLVLVQIVKQMCDDGRVAARCTSNAARTFGMERRGLQDRTGAWPHAGARASA